MANHGVGSKFVSVNLNKSYGQPANSSGPSRLRSSVHGGGGGGGGMVVLSRHRSSLVGAQKNVSRLSVPPPLNLPSLRKEHERSDSSASGGGLTGSGTTGSGSRPTSSGMGWSKPAPSTLPEKASGNDHSSIERSSQIVDGGGNLSSYSSDVRSRGDSVYMPPSARSGTVGPALVPATRSFPVAEKAVVLKGEDFPSLQATLPLSGNQKQQDNLLNKQKLKASEEEVDVQKGSSYSSSSSLHMPLQVQSRLPVGNNTDENKGGSYVMGRSSTAEQSRKQDSYFPGPLPLVRLKHTSDWADDERDVGHSIPDRDRDHGYLKKNSTWDDDLNFPRISMPSRASVPKISDGRSARDDEAGKGGSKELIRGNHYNKDVRVPSREGYEGSSWRSSSISKDGGGFGVRENGIDRNGVGARSSNMSWETNKETKYSDDHSRGGFNSGQRNSYEQGNRQSAHNFESFSGRGGVQNARDQYSVNQSNRYKADFFPSSLAPKAPVSNKVIPDRVFNFGKEKRNTSAKSYIEDPFLNDIVSGPGFDGIDPLTGGLVGVFKRKKDVLKQVDFHDPVRESFEAELERVQKMQEQERQRVVEEQARALEIARKEEEDRERLAREEEEWRRRVEEEAREAAWRAEQERLEVIRRAEEQKIAREEEKQRILMEEERRKENARKKLMELEARIAMRQTEEVKDDKFPDAVREDRMRGKVKETDFPGASDVGDWEDGERMVERITTSASSDASNPNRSFDSGPRPPFSRDGDSAFIARGRPTNSWRRDVFEHGNSSNFMLQDHEDNYRGPRGETYGSERVFPRKEFYGGSGIIPGRSSSKGGISEPHPFDDFSHLRGHRWNLDDDRNHYGMNQEADPEFYDNSIDKFGDLGWGQGRSRGSLHASYPDRLYQNFEADERSAYSRPRHSVRQPRVLPPPSLASMHKNTTSAEMENPNSTFSAGEMRYHHAVRKPRSILRTDIEERVEQPRIMDAELETISQDQKVEKATFSRCDSQSSLSVSSPPHSPNHLSLDDLENSGDSPVLPSTAKSEEISLTENEHDFSVAEPRIRNNISSSNVASAIEDDEWAMENDEELQEQEEYDEEEDGYLEEDEVQEGDDENTNLGQEFESLHLDVKETSGNMGQTILGFNEGVQVGIPSGDEFERSSRNGDMPVGTQVGTFSGLSGNGQDSVPEYSSPETILQSSNNVAHETQNVVQDLAVQPGNLAASVGHGRDIIEASVNVSLPAQQNVTTTAALPSPVVQPIKSPISVGVSQAAEVPVTLQFGLFSGPSLIPSPVPAIQIGSIQMPLHLHPQVGSSLSHMHPSQPPFFQFGQLRYASPVSQGILPLGPQSVSFVQPSAATHYPFSQNQGNTANIGVAQGTLSQTNLTKSSSLLDDQHGVPKFLELTQDNSPTKVSVLPATQSADKEILSSQSESISVHVNDMAVKKNDRYGTSNKESLGQLQPEAGKSQYVSRAPGPLSGSKGKRFIYNAKNSGPRPANPVSDGPYRTYAVTGEFQRRPRQKFYRTEFRVRDNFEKRQIDGLGSAAADDKMDFPGKMSEKSNGSHGVDLESKTERLREEAPAKRLASSLNISSFEEANSKRNSSSMEDIDAPMHSGVVRVFRQPGIEASSNEDDFITVKTKKQMLNDRREQREKEIKAKSQVMKASRKPRSVPKKTGPPAYSGKAPASLVREAARSVPTNSPLTNVQGLSKIDIGSGFTNNIVSQPLAPIGTPAVNADAPTVMRSSSIKSFPRASVTVISNCGSNLVTSFDNQSTALDSVPTSLGTWGSGRVNQQVMNLTQTQLDDAMKTARFDSRVACIGDQSSVITERCKAPPSNLTQDKSFSSASSPLSSLLNGEKIQFGAVTSPTILPSSSCAISSAIGHPASSRPKPSIPVENSLPAAVESGHSLIFEKEQCPDENCAHLHDPEAEAEAAASAVAVAAISSDEIVGSGVDACSVSVSGAGGFGNVDIENIASGGGSGNQQLIGRSRGEESLTVALPADLSVEMPSLSLWPPLPSPQNSSSQMLSHFTAPTSHFPCYEMNPMLGGPIFAFAPHDESAGTESQTQKSNTSGQGPLGAWQQCHSGADSFYGPPAGFTGPFIGPPGGMPGVQGPPHMVVYNHFAPVGGQFGQVGLSYMGTTYIPSGKQPDWKHNPVPTSTVGISEGETSSLSNASAQQSSPSIPTPIQHLAPGSPLMPLPSPFAMFDMSRFQSSTDVPVQARWSHVPAPHLHPVPLSLPLQQQPEGGFPPQFSHGLSLPVDQSTGSRFYEHNSLPPDSHRSFPGPTAVTGSQFPDGLGLVESSSSTTPGTHVLNNSRPVLYNPSNGNANKVQRAISKSTSRNTSANNEVGGGGGNHNNNGSGGSNSQSMSSAHKNQSTNNQQQNPNQQHYLHQSGGYNTDQRGNRAPQKVGSGSGSGNDWSHRRMGSGYQGRNQSSGTDKNFQSQKTKQIYVAKTTSSVTSSKI